MAFHILAINPGSTSTKVALYEEERPLFDFSLRHTADELAPFGDVIEQLPWRLKLILDALREREVALNTLSAVIGRGGLIRPVPSGTYEVNERMQADLRNARMRHACNLGGLLAAEIARRAGVKAYIADPPVVDEMEEAAHLTGMPACRRHSIFHALNHKATARLHCQKVGADYEAVNLIVAHMGGGISVAAHRRGRVVEVNNALDGDGPFAPDRAGSLPSSELIRVCFSGEYTCEELLRFVSSRGGLVAYLGTNSVIETIERIEQGDEQARLVFEAMCYTVAKQICAMAAPLAGQVDAILLTGGIAYSQQVVEHIRTRCGFLAPVFVYPGENEIESLAQNALAHLRGIRPAQVY